jgi:hypothetical protein
MAIESKGVVHMRGDSTHTIAVDVYADEETLRLLSGDEVIGDWPIHGMGIHALDEGFAIRAEGEELILKTDDDVGLAEQLGLMTSSPRLARKMAASHNVEGPPPVPLDEPEAEAEAPRSNLAAIAFALGGVLVFAGGAFLRAAPGLGGSEPVALGSYWLAFMIGGLVMVAIAYLLSRGARWAQVAAILAVAAMIIVFALAVQNVTLDPNDLLAYGFLAGGIVVGVSVLFSGSLSRER